MIRLLLLFVVLGLLPSPAPADEIAGDSVQARMSRDVAAGKPLVAHVVVALCDNEHQGIVRVPAHLGRGDDPNSNLYWGALYGVKTYFSRHPRWTRIAVAAPERREILDRIAFHSTVARDGTEMDIYLVAEAWDGKEIRAATARFLQLLGGAPDEVHTLRTDDAERVVLAGGASHLIAYVGHNGLMDFGSPAVTEPDPLAGARSSIVLACESHDYFSPLLRFKRAHGLLTTNGLMAPEAYTLEAAVSAWFSGKSPGATRDIAADAYAEYQNANPNWSRRLFATDGE